MPTTINGATRAAMDAILKDHYLGPIRDQLNSSTILMSRLKRDTESIDGRIAKIPIRIGRNRGIQAVLEKGTLPEPRKQQYATVEVPMAWNYGLIQVTGQAMAASRTNMGAFVRILDQEITGMIEDLSKDLNRQLWGDGSGRLGIIEGPAAANTVNIRGVHDFNDQESQLKFIEPGDFVAFENISTAGLLQGFATALDAGGGVFQEVVSVDLAAKTMTMTSITATTAAGDAVVKGPNTSDSVASELGNFRGGTGAAAPNEKKEIMGLVGIVNGPNGWAQHPIATASFAAYTPIFQLTEGDCYAGTWSGNDVIKAKLQNYQNALWAANVLFNGGVLRSLDTDLLQQGFDLVERNGRAKPSIGITNYGVRRRYIDLLVPDRRFIGQYTYKLDGGWSAIDFNGIPIVVDQDCPEGSLFFLSEPNLKLYTMSDFHWLDKDGAILKYVDRRDAWEAVLAYYAELGTDRRNAHCAIGDIQV